MTETNQRGHEAAPLPSFPKPPSDEHLTSAGLHFEKAAAPILVIGCGALARELLAVMNANSLDHVSLTCLPAILHNRPEKIAPAIREIVLDKHAHYQRIFLAYADCGTGGKLSELCAELGLEMIEGPHCYSFYEGNARFAARTEEDIRTFYLTDFLARQFDAFVWKPLGLDRHPELLETYFGHYEKLVYQAQSDDPSLDDKARECAARLGLAYERRLTGYGDLEKAVLRWGGR